MEIKWNVKRQYGNTSYTMVDEYGNIRYKVEKTDNGNWKVLSQFSIGVWKKIGVYFSTAKKARAYCEERHLTYTV